MRLYNAVSADGHRKRLEKTRTMQKFVYRRRGAWYRMEADSTKAAKQRVSAYVKSWSPMLAKVTYGIGGRTVASASSPPWTASVDFAPYKGRAIDVAVQAYDGRGKLVTTRKVRVAMK
ncbi:hypothetical protein SAMN02799624_04847 [Paenibacillus sp. UNC496MF]|nr:hypothetical protein SAMN02799624_04847 [Paenibacillus sp. UNC496MF]